jgi:hypothetical protein
MSRGWLIGSVAAAIAIVSLVWRAWRAHRHTRADFGSISDAWMNEHRARERDTDRNR